MRKLIRLSKLSISNTSGMAEGFKQANVIILHKSLADDFEKFCQANDGPLPLLYRGKPGEWKCPPLSNDSDISPDYGDTVHAHPGDVPVFWACGVTGIEAVSNCSMEAIDALN
ncbi:D-glutamate cyclase, mitochondrial [Varanus komodoensis]|nr:D-glutamate cyclase, mitochondrial [Varanus komodoensis]